MKTATKLWLWLAVFIACSPLGLILPAWFNAGSAWGEWSADEIQKMMGYVPSGMSTLTNLWEAPMPDYAFGTQQNASISTLSASYILSGLVGVVLVVALSTLVGKALVRSDDNEHP